MKSIVVGSGEIGGSVYNLLSREYELDIYDIRYTVDPKDSKVYKGDYFIMHVCFPYSDKFVEQVEEYKQIFKPKYTIIHSTVPVGTSRKCKAVNSPVVGIHPHLEESLKTFTKFLGGEDASHVANYFRRCGMKVYITDKQESTELMKIQDTTSYALMIEFYKDMKKRCDEFGVPFELWTLWCQNYNEGYAKLGYPEYSKPLLTPIMISQNTHSHCTIPNLKLLDTPFTKFLKEIT